MKSWWLVPVLVVAVALAVWVHAAGADPSRQPPPRLTSTGIAALSDAEIIGRVTADLRWRLVNLPPAQMTRWRSFPAPARHLLALAPVVDASDLPPPVFEGFAALVESSLPTAPTLAEIAEAFTAIGAAAEAEAVAAAGLVARPSGIQAAGRAGPGSGGADGYAAHDRRLRALLATGGAGKRLRAYLRQHADEIASASIR